MATGQQVARVIDSQDEYYDLERMRAMKESAHEAWALDHGKKHTESEFYRSFHEKYQTGYLVYMDIYVYGPGHGHTGCGCMRDPWHMSILPESAIIFFPHIYPTEFPLDDAIQMELANSLLKCEVWPTGVSRGHMKIDKVEPGCILQARASPNESVATWVDE